MTARHVLHGGCQCGRNTYVVEIPALERSRLLEHAHVFLDQSETTRRYHAAPLTVHLRVPLAWFHSTTHAFYAGETHASIRRSSQTPVLSVPNEKTIADAKASSATAAVRRFAEDMSHVNRGDAPLLPSFDQRHFCGFCGTHMTRWDEVNQQRADCISISLGSLYDDDVELLGDIGLLPEAGEELFEDSPNPVEALVGGTQLSSQSAGLDKDEGVSAKGTAWFESLIQDSQLGRLSRQRRRGTHERDGVRVTWIVEELSDARGGDKEMADDQERAKRRRTEN